MSGRLLFRRLLLGLFLFAESHSSTLAQDPSLPVVTTLPAGPIGAVRATLRGSIVAATSDAIVHFEYSTDSQLADAISTPEQPVVAAGSPQEVSAQVSVGEATTYYFRIVAWTDQGTMRGEIVALNTGYSGGTIPESLTETTVEFREWLGHSPSVSRHVEYGKAIDGVTSTVDNVVNNLEAGTTYYYRYVTATPHTVMGVEFWQPQYGPWQSFVTAGTANPAQTTAAVGATDITTTTATFHGRVNPGEDATTAAFEYLYSGAAGFVPWSVPEDSAILQGVTPEQSVGSGAAWTELIAPVVGLAPGTRIFVWIITRNARGEVRTPLSDGFTTPFGAPKAWNVSASFVQGYALLASQVTNGGLDADYFFEYGTKRDLSDAISTRHASFPHGDFVLSAHEEIDNLVPGTTYYFRAIVTNSAGTARSETGSFVAISSLAPQVETLPPRQVTPTSAILRASVVPNGGATTVEFYLDLHGEGLVSYGLVDAGNGTEAVVVELPVTGLVPNETYLATATATNSYYSYGGNVAFTTRVGPANVGPAKFDLVIMEGDLALNPLPAARLQLHVGRTGILTGKMTVDGVSYPLHSVLNSGAATLRVNLRRGPTVALAVILTEERDGLRKLTASIDRPGSRKFGEGIQAIGSETPVGIANSRYTIILPMRASTQGPQGDGFLVGEISANGKVRMVGQTGDGKRLVLTGLLQRDLTLPVGLIIGRGTRNIGPFDYLVGHLDFATNALGTVSGNLFWTHDSVSDQYRQSFGRVSQPVGARYVPAKSGSPIFNDSTGRNAVLELFDDVRTSLLQMPLSLDSNGYASGSQFTKFQMERRTGLFRGSAQPLPTNSTKVKFHGVVVPALDRGAGWVEINGRIGAAELSPN